MATVGDVNTREEFVIEWKIRNFFGLSKKVNKIYYSPAFTFFNEFWYLWINPNGKEGESEGYIDLFLHRCHSGTPINLDYFLELKRFDGMTYAQSHCKYQFKKAEGYGKYKLFNRATLIKKKEEFVPFCTLTVICRILSVKPNTASSITLVTKCEYCKESLRAQEDVSAHQQKCMERPIKCPQCHDVIALKGWYDHKCQIVEAGDNQKLVSDFKEIMMNGELSDILIKVKGNEFRLHKTILAARNSYFHAMFKNDMKEKITGVVYIDDCEPHLFSSFIHFLYTGSVEKLSPENMFDLYEISNKYQEEQLKKKCFDLMLHSMSVDNLCDVVKLALRLDDRILLQETTKYFAGNTKEIIRSVKWQAFLIDYPIQANELLIKALDYSGDK